ncbi:MAG: PqqD family protein [Candidatus Thermoplasmatota archaeon]|nr:PqqD family protein [Candidatus Thermoplasmatota archaeon]
MDDSGPDEDPKKGKGRPSKWWREGDRKLVQHRIEEVTSSMGFKKVDLDDSDREALVQEARKRDPRLRNMLDVVFERADRVSREGEYLTIPIYRSKMGESIARALRIRTRRRIRLDGYGWAVWELLDGRRTLERVGEELKKRFGDEIEPIYPRLARFMTYLVNLGLARERA